MPKDTTSARTASRRHNPLHEELASLNTARTKPSRSSKHRSPDGEDDHHSSNAYVDAGLSRKILRIAREQQDELQEEEKKNGASSRRRSNGVISPGGSSTGSGFSASAVRFNAGEYDEESEEEYDGEEYDDDDYEEVEEVVVDEADLDLFNKFLPPSSSTNAPEQRISLADKILEKIAQHEAALAGLPFPDSSTSPTPSLPPKVIEVYTRVGQLLSRYKSGKLPRAFKIIPSLKNWEEILFLTRPDQWSPHACYEATKMFASNLKSNQTQRFMNNILLERIRDDIAEHKKLNVHLYRALKKSLYKPAAFFKGFLFPLAASGTCTLREATIVSSVLTRVSVPVLHSAAALLRLAEMPSSGATAIFIRTLLDKKYALPYKVVDSLVIYFAGFRNVEGSLPVLWHRSLLSFAQRYKNDVSEEQRDVLLDVLLEKGHWEIGPEIRRELVEGRARGVVNGLNGVNGVNSVNGGQAGDGVVDVEMDL
ncbi:Bystin-domain-containing protein [Terfezia claveryi]|nr:Bystin-domain-containing protein [Terfezia claveryi]